jgi:endo-1,4-beta-xylanase
MHSSVRFQNHPTRKNLSLAGIATVLAIVALAPTLAVEPALKEVFKDDFRIGAALNASHFSGTPSLEAELVERHFNTITPENALKWVGLQPRPGQYTFEQADRFVEFGQRREMVVIGHTLVWHSQTPRWVFQEADGTPPAKEVLLSRMRDHIHTVVGRYKGRIAGWDVVNEAIGDDGRLRESPWLKILGEEYLVKAYEFAHEADPDAELYYNDYGLESGRKREGALKMLRKLQASGVKLTGVGLQGHYHLDFPSPRQMRETIEAFANLGLAVMITELDVNVLPTPGPGGADVSQNFRGDPKWDPYAQGLPPEIDQRLARRYSELFAIFLQHRDAVSRVTFWGVTDRESWLNHFPIRGRTNYPLLFGRDGKPKSAFHAVVDTRGPAR